MEPKDGGWVKKTLFHFSASAPEDLRGAGAQARTVTSPPNASRAWAANSASLPRYLGEK